MFAQKASVSAAVKSEQDQIEKIVSTVESVFMTQPDFSSLGGNGASYLRNNSTTSLQFSLDETGHTVISTPLGSGRVHLSSSQFDISGQPNIPGNSFSLRYTDLSAGECISLVTSSHTRSMRVDVGAGPVQGSDTLVSLNGKMEVAPDRLATLCRSSGQKSWVELTFSPPRALASSASPVLPPSSTCRPDEQTQLANCPAGQVGSIVQKRFGNCSGPGNTMVYTAWHTVEDTCQDQAVEHPTEKPEEIPHSCGISTSTMPEPCPVGEIGQIIKTQTVNTCTGVVGPWEVVSDSCQAPAPIAACHPGVRQEVVGCPAGQGGQIIRALSSSCATALSDPSWSSQVVSNTCTTSCVSSGTCCRPQRQVRTTDDPCPSGTYGNSNAQQERYRSCLSPTVQGGWSSWQTLSTSGGCTACPSPANQTQTRWTKRTGSCPDGQTGTVSWEVNQTRARVVSYSCPSGTTSLPSPSYGTWGAWTDTVQTRNHESSCEAISSCPALPPQASVLPSTSMPYSYWKDYIHAFRTNRTGDNQTPPPAPCSSSNIGQQATVFANITSPSEFCQNLSSYICSPSGWIMLTYRTKAACDAGDNLRPDLSGGMLSTQHYDRIDQSNALQGSQPHVNMVWNNALGSNPNALVSYGCMKFDQYW